MADALKEMFNPSYFQRLALEIKKVWSPFSSKEFLRAVCEGLDHLSLNERMRHCVLRLATFLPSDYKKAIGILKEAIPSMPSGYQNLLFPDFVSQFGLEHPTFSLEALKYFTRFGSSEFAVRHFIRQDPQGTLKVMAAWALDENAHVRRLASEGSRPRLPWSFKLDVVLENPDLTRPIVQALRSDPSAYVRKSVANHLNDLSKDYAPYMLELVASWDLSDPATAWIVKHACRTLIKKGNPAALALFQFESKPAVELTGFAISSSLIALGDRLQFSFQLRSTAERTQKLVVDYRIHYQKQHGQVSGKVFKLKELQLLPGETVSITKGQVIKDFTTRKHHAGTHTLEILVNGLVLQTADFELTLD